MYGNVVIATNIFIFINNVKYLHCNETAPDKSSGTYRYVKTNYSVIFVCYLFQIGFKMN